MTLNLIFIAIAALSTGGIYLFADAVSPWLILPILLGGYAAAVVAFLLLLEIAALIFLPKRGKIDRPKKLCAAMIRLTMEWVMLILRVKIDLRGSESLPNGPCVLVSNHRSDFDPMTVLAVLRGKKLAFISKEANFKIPIVGNYIYHAGFLAIDRGNGMRALRTIKQAAEMVKAGSVDIMGIYPEGTRSKTGELLRFKSGAFLLAKKADAPIAVMVTKNTERVFRNFPFRSTKVEMEILEIIPREEVAEAEHNALAERSRNLIEAALRD